jgi:hypothetical protein
MPTEESIEEVEETDLNLELEEDPMPTEEINEEVEEGGLNLELEEDLMPIEEINENIKDINLELEELLDEAEWAFGAGIGSMSMVRDTLQIWESNYICR